VNKHSTDHDLHCHWSGPGLPLSWSEDASADLRGGSEVCAAARWFVPCPITEWSGPDPKRLVSVLCGGSSNRPRATFPSPVQLRTTWKAPADSTATERLRPSRHAPTPASQCPVSCYRVPGLACLRQGCLAGSPSTCALCTCAARPQQEEGKGRGAWRSSGSEGVEERSTGQRRLQTCAVCDV
jgi:hypothetical protein